MQRRSRAWPKLFRHVVVCCTLIGLLGLGCSGSREAARQGFMRVITPLPPPFLTGPASVLLTNSPGFSARIELQPPGAIATDKPSAGQLLGRGSQLLYAPETDENTDTHRRPGGYSFIWDVAQSRGYVLSEALQGYAPVAADLHVTNISFEIGKAPAQRFSGHPSESAAATISMTDGGTAHFELLRAIDLNGFPIRIASPTNSSVFTLSFSKVRLEQPSAEVFAPPDGFTKYASPEAMADELAARQNNLRRKGSQILQPIPDLNSGRY